MRSPEADTTERFSIVGAVVLLGAATLLAYANSFTAAFVLDDWTTLLQNPSIRSLSAIFTPAESTGLSGRPIANASFVLNYFATGLSLGGLHAVNLVIHFCAGLALFGLVGRTLEHGKGWLPPMSRGWVPVAVAGLWLLHPMQTQSVTYVSQRTEELMGLFYFLALYAFSRAVKSAVALPWQIIAVLACLAGVACKESMVTAPVMILLYDRTFVAGSFKAAWARRWRFYLATMSCWPVLSLLMQGLGSRGVGFGQGMTPWSYLAIEAGAVLRYAGLALWPARLVFDYGDDVGIAPLYANAGIVILVLLLFMVIVALRRWPTVGFLGAWFFITLAPTSSVVPIPLQPISENRTYLSTAAMVVALVLLIARLRKSHAVCAIVAIAVAFTALTAARNADYRSPLRLWEDTVAKMPSSSRAHNNLGQAFFEAGRAQEAQAEFEAALRLKPRYARAYTNLAAVAGRANLPELAMQYSRRAIEIDPLDAAAFDNLGRALAETGKLAEATAAYEASLRLRPQSVENHNRLARLLLAQGRFEQAIAHSAAALQIEPLHVDAHYCYAYGLLATGRAAAAVPHFEIVLRYQPEHFDALLNLGAAYQQLGRLNEARGSFEKASRLHPDSPIVINAMRSLGPGSGGK